MEQMSELPQRLAELEHCHLVQVLGSPVSVHRLKMACTFVLAQRTFRRDVGSAVGPPLDLAALLIMQVEHVLSLSGREYERSQGLRSGRAHHRQWRTRPAIDEGCVIHEEDSAPELLRLLEGPRQRWKALHHHREFDHGRRRTTALQARLPHHQHQDEVYSYEMSVKV